MLELRAMSAKHSKHQFNSDFNFMKLRNVYLGLKDQLPLRRFVRNLLKGNLYGLFHKRSHWTHEGKEKVKYNTKATAQKAAEAMKKKTGVYFSNYKCVYCDGYHIGKNLQNQPYYKAK